MKAFVLIKVEKGSDKEVSNHLTGISNVTEIHVIPGEYDILIELKSDGMLFVNDKLFELIIQDIRTIKGIFLTALNAASNNTKAIAKSSLFIFFLFNAEDTVKIAR